MHDAANLYDTAKFTDREIEDELNNRPPRHRSEAYLAALRAEAASRRTNALGGPNPDEGDREGNERDAGGRAPSAANRQESPRIRFTLTATTTLESLWYDEQWHRELVEDGLTDEQALKEMLRVGFEEDGLSILWEMFGPPPETAKYFAQAITEVCVVQP